jgi:myo-inositol-1(or 4)-monophosphatase
MPNIAVLPLFPLSLLSLAYTAFQEDINILDAYLRVCEEAARLGGRVIQDWVGRAEVRKKGPADLVTQADVASQEAVRRAVLGAYPDHCFLGEEKTSGEVAASRTEYRWIVDPLDGTTNFVHGVPHYCVSLALERNGELLVGTVYDPILDECFTAAAGQGSRLNGRPIHTSDVAELSEALAAVGFPPDVPRDAPDLLMFLEMLHRCQAIRRTGSSALNLCYLAAGRFDVYWSYSTRIWDVAAGVLILREAGGLATSPKGGEFCLEEAHFLAAANRGLHAQLCDVAAKFVPSPARVRTANSSPLPPGEG